MIFSKWKRLLQIKADVDWLKFIVAESLVFFSLNNLLSFTDQKWSIITDFADLTWFLRSKTDFYWILFF